MQKYLKFLLILNTSLFSFQGVDFDFSGLKNISKLGEDLNKLSKLNKDFDSLKKISKIGTDQNQTTKENNNLKNSLFEKKIENKKYSLAEAQKRCEQLSTNEKSVWYLPSFKEMLEISSNTSVNLKNNQKIFIKPEYLKVLPKVDDVNKLTFWTSDKSVEAGYELGTIVSFAYSKSDLESAPIDLSSDKSSKNYVICKKTKSKKDTNKYLADKKLSKANKLYYLQNKEKSSFLLYKSAAKYGSIEAKAQLIKMYYYGVGVKKDIEKAKELYNQGVISSLKKLAEKNNTFAQYLYAYFLDHGIFIKKNIDEATQWYKKASISNSTAMNNLAIIYKKIKNCKEAVNLLEKAISLENPVSMYNLGIWYEKGICVGKDTEKAKMYYRLSANYDYKDAKKNLKKLLDNEKEMVERVMKNLERFEKQAKQEEKIKHIKNKILNAKLYKNSCTVPSVPDAGASSREIERFKRKDKSYTNCINRVKKRNNEILYNLVKESGGIIKSRNGSVTYSYPKIYTDEFNTLLERINKIDYYIRQDYNELERNIQRRNSKVKSINRWKQLSNDLQESLDKVNRQYQNNPYQYQYNPYGW